MTLYSGGNDHGFLGPVTFVQLREALVKRIIGTHTEL